MQDFKDINNFTEKKLRNTAFLDAAVLAFALSLDTTGSFILTLCVCFIFGSALSSAIAWAFYKGE